MSSDVFRNQFCVSRIYSCHCLKTSFTYHGVNQLSFITKICRTIVSIPRLEMTERIPPICVSTLSTSWVKTKNFDDTTLSEIWLQLAKYYFVIHEASSYCDSRISQCTSFGTIIFAVLQWISTKMFQSLPVVSNVSWQKERNSYSKLKTFFFKFLHKAIFP